MLLWRIQSLIFLIFQDFEKKDIISKIFEERKFSQYKRKINLSCKLIRTNDKKICHLQVIKSLIPNPQEN